MTPEIVRAIRERRASGETLHVIGRDYGINASSVSKIARRVTWDDID